MGNGIAWSQEKESRRWERKAGIEAGPWGRSLENEELSRAENVNSIYWSHKGLRVAFSQRR